MVNDKLSFLLVAEFEQRRQYIMKHVGCYRPYLRGNPPVKGKEVELSRRNDGEPWEKYKVGENSFLPSVLQALQRHC